LRFFRRLLPYKLNSTDIEQQQASKNVGNLVSWMWRSDFRISHLGSVMIVVIEFHQPYLHQPCSVLVFTERIAGSWRRLRPYFFGWGGSCLRAGCAADLLVSLVGESESGLN